MFFRMIRTFLTEKIDFECPDFMIDIKKHFATFDFFVKMKLVSTVVH